MENSSLAGMAGCDRDLFSRVWARVSPTPGEACPIEVLPAASVSSPLPSLPCSQDTPATDSPAPSDVPCLGSAGGEYTTFLQQAILHELDDWRTYQSLSARSSPSAARTLSAMAADERRHARRLCAAYFLLSGIRFSPHVPPLRQHRGSLWGTLRERFWEEQRGAALYAAAAEETADPCLSQLFRELSAEEAAHADLLRHLVEQM